MVRILSGIAFFGMVGLVFGCAHAEPRVQGASPPAKAQGTQPRAASSQPTQIRPLGAVPSTQPTLGAHSSVVSMAGKPAASQPAAGLSSRGEPSSQPASRPAMPASQPTIDPLVELREAVSRELARPEWARIRVSFVVKELGQKDPLVAVHGAARRVPASNAKLLTTVAAAKLLHGGFATEVLYRGRRVYLRGTGDPLLSGRELEALARRARARGVRRVDEVVVDDSYYGRRRLAPGFGAFLAGSPYRPTSGAVNVGSNAVLIAVSAPRGRRRPRVDVSPPSDYVKVRKLVRYAKGRRGKASRVRRIRVTMRPRGSILWLTVSGTMGRRAKPYRVARAVYDPGLNAGWALRRALKKAGAKVRGTVRRGRAPHSARRVARKGRSLAAVLHAVNRRSHNLAAENLIRAMGSLRATKKARRQVAAGSWSRGLTRATAILRSLGLRDFTLRNGSGLHRKTTITANDLVRLLEAIHSDSKLRRKLMPTLAVAGRSGTLRPRMRDTSAEGIVYGKTGTLGNVLALSGFVLPKAAGRKLAFSLLVNGTGRRRVRERMDQLVATVARYATGQPLLERPATVPVALD